MLPTKFSSVQTRCTNRRSKQENKSFEHNQEGPDDGRPSGMILGSEGTSGGSALGLGDFEDDHIGLAGAAKHSIACYRQEAHETACRLVRELNPLIV